MRVAFQEEIKSDEGDQEGATMNPQRKRTTYDRRTDGDSTAQRQLILDRDIDSGYAIYGRTVRVRGLLIQTTDVPAIARTVGNKMRAVHSLLIYLLTVISFAVTTSSSAVTATSCKSQPVKA